jgi:hypothetical protein
MTLFCLLLHLCQLVLIVEHFEGLIEETVGLQIKLLLDLHIQSLDFHLKIAYYWILVELIIEGVLD